MELKQISKLLADKQVLLFDKVSFGLSHNIKTHEEFIELEFDRVVAAGSHWTTRMSDPSALCVTVGNTCFLGPIPKDNRDDFIDAVEAALESAIADKVSIDMQSTYIEPFTGKSITTSSESLVMPAHGVTIDLVDVSHAIFYAKSALNDRKEVVPPLDLKNWVEPLPIHTEESIQEELKNSFQYFDWVKSLYKLDDGTVKPYRFIITPSSTHENIVIEHAAEDDIVAPPCDVPVSFSTKGQGKVHVITFCDPFGDVGKLLSKTGVKICFADKVLYGIKFESTDAVISVVPQAV